MSTFTLPVGKIERLNSADVSQREDIWSDRSQMLHTVGRLAAAQALFQTSSIISMMVGVLAGASIAVDPRLATAPIAAIFLGTAVATVPASAFMARFGRRAGFVTGSVLGGIGGLLAALGIAIGSLWLLCAGTLLVGVNQAAAQFYRFAASEVADSAFRPRAISLVLAGGVVAAFSGPALGRFGTSVLETTFAGAFLIVTAVNVVAVINLLGLDIPNTPDCATNGTPRPLAQIVAQRKYRVALFAAATGYAVMVLAMTAAPVAMMHLHHDIDATALVIQMHVLGMYVPSFFTGGLIARFGVHRIMLAGVAVLALYIGLALTGASLISFASGLAMLGIGWNFLFVGGTTLLTETYRHAERAKAQAVNDLTIFTSGLFAAAGAGMMLAVLGWQAMNLALVPILGLAALAIFKDR